MRENGGWGVRKYFLEELCLKNTVEIKQAMKRRKIKQRNCRQKGQTLNGRVENSIMCADELKALLISIGSGDPPFVCGLS